MYYNLYMGKYFEQRDNNNIDKINAIMDNDLPDFCVDYFMGIEQRTTTLTRLNYAYDIRLFLQFLTIKVRRFVGKSTKDITLADIEALSPYEFELYMSWLTKYNDPKTSAVTTNSAAGKKRKLCSIRAIIKYFCKKQLMNSDPTVSVDNPKLRSKDIVRLDSHEIQNMIAVVDTGEGMSQRQRSYQENTRTRDMAIVSLLLATGIRVSELVGMDIDDIDFDNNSFVVTRKGGARVILYYPEEIAGTLMDYHMARSNYYKNHPDDKALFLSLQNRRLTTRSVENIIKKYSQIATPLKNISPHKLRSTFGTQLYRSTGDIYIVADVLGHKDVNTTKKHYAAISDDVRRKAAAKVTLLPSDDESN